MKLLVKYCGGCNVYYDRVALVESIKARLPQLEITYQGDSADYVAVLCGCSSACLNHSGLEGRLGKSVLTAAEDGQALVDTLTGLVARENQK